MRQQLVGEVPSYVMTAFFYRRLRLGLGDGLPLRLLFMPELLMRWRPSVAATGAMGATWRPSGTVWFTFSFFRKARLRILACIAHSTRST
jgi:hypothetical protein